MYSTGRTSSLAAATGYSECTADPDLATELNNMLIRSLESSANKHFKCRNPFACITLLRLPGARQRQRSSWRSLPRSR